MKTRTILRRCIVALLSALCIFSLCMAWKEYAEQSGNRHALEELAAQINEPVTEPEPSQTENKPNTAVPQEEPPPEETVTHKRNLAPIIEQNGECIGWLCIPDTEIDYPIMHTPTDPQKYLRRNFDGEYSTAGIPFLDHRCTLDGNLLVFGHNMKNGTMFGSLNRYLDDEYRQAHSTIEFETPAGLRLFTVTKVICTDTSDAWYDRTAPEDDKTYLILSTCHGSSKNGRLLVIAEEMQP